MTREEMELIEKEVVRELFPYLPEKLEVGGEDIDGADC